MTRLMVVCACWLVLLAASLPARAAVVVADSVSEFSNVQGQDNWYYGYVEPVTSPNFLLMTQFLPDQPFAFPSMLVDTWLVQKDVYWTRLNPLGGHPNGTNFSSVAVHVVQWPVRRWISELSGPINISGQLFKANPLGGNGIVGRIDVDGTTIWSQYIAGTDGTGVPYSIPATVNVGSTVDFVIAPFDANDSSDGTSFIATISTTVPEPSSLVLWLVLAVSGIVFCRWRRRTPA